MFCQGCGNEMVDDAAFCPKCGRPVAGGGSPYTVAAAPPKDPTEMFNIAGCFLWFFMLLKEKMIAAAIISLALVVIPLGYMLSVGGARADMEDIGLKYIDDMDRWETNIEDAVSGAARKGISSIVTALGNYVGVGGLAGSITDSAIGPYIDEGVNEISNELLVASGEMQMKNDMLDKIDGNVDRYYKWNVFWFIVTVVVFVLLCVFWGRRYNYYVDLNSKGTPFLCAIGDPGTRKL